MFYQHIVYVQVFENKFDCMFVPSGERKTIIAEEPFSSDKLLVADFDLADKILQREIIPNKKGRFFKHFLRRSSIIMHQRDQADSMCPTEIKILEELAYGSGAGYKCAFVWQGPELSVEDIMNGVYKNS